MENTIDNSDVLPKNVLETSLLQNESSNDNINVNEINNRETIEPKFTGHIRNASFLQTLINLLKANFGLGILNYPQAIYRSGIIFGPITTIIMIIISCHCVFLLSQSAREMRRRYNKDVIGYAGTARYAFIPYLNTKSRYIVYIVNFFLITSQFGGCIAYADFTANTLYAITDNKFDDVRIWIVIVFCMILIPSLLSNFEIISVLSGCANLLSLFGLATTFVYIFMNIPPARNVKFIGSIHEIPLYFSTFLFITKSTTAVLPIENECKNPADFTLALKIVFGIFYSTLFVFGICGYLAFGEQIRDSITLNLPFNTFYNIVKIAYALGMLLTFFIGFHVLMSVTTPTLLKITQDSKKKIIIKYGFRLAVIILIGACAVSIPKIENIIALVGAFACSSLSIIFPPLIHIAIYWKEYDGQPSLSRIAVIKDIIIAVIGLILCIAGVYSTVTKLVQNT